MLTDAGNILRQIPNSKAGKPAVWVDKTAEGKIAVSIPQADRIGSATVREH